MYEIVVSDPRLIKDVKTWLEEQDVFVKPMLQENGNKILRTTLDDKSSVELKFPSLEIREYKTVNQCEVTQHDISGITRQFFKDKIDKEILEELLNHLPLKYSIYPPLMLFNNSTKRSFTHEIFNRVAEFMPEYFEMLLSHYRLDVIANNKPIQDDDNTMRQPKNIMILYKRDGKIQNDDEIWCQTKQNGIWQVWNPMYTMFSRGNIKEKKRILDTYPDIENNDVIDLYCGIGYFSLSYIKRRCRYLFGFELNEWSVRGLHQGLALNHKIIQNPSNINIYNENNESSVQRIREFLDAHSLEALRIRHINMGLLPSSQQGYPIALKLAKFYNDWNQCPIVTLHIHENVNIHDIQSGDFIRNTLQTLQSLSLSSNFHFQAIYLEQIKTYAPDIWHVCLDVNLTVTTSPDLQKD